MEDTLRVNHILSHPESVVVLILVLMEDTLRDKDVARFYKDVKCLNPCFNGRYSQRVEDPKNLLRLRSLNPCFNGRYSQRARHTNPLYKRDWYL